MDTPVSQMESSPAWEMENVVVLASVREDAEGLIHKVALLKGDLVEAHRAWGWLKRRFIACLAHPLSVRGG
jgi:hypothetical protein